MLQPWFPVPLWAAGVGLLFGVAHYGDRDASWAGERWIGSRADKFATFGTDRIGLARRTRTRNRIRTRTLGGEVRHACRDTAGNDRGDLKQSPFWCPCRV
jgi:hypothetical protein